jgi:DNA invertase Pin-like site-specific DNA recombinase
MTRHKQAASSRKPLAISFLRYSDPAKQRRGDSSRRQTADSEAWCQRNGVPLDKQMRHGGSAFHGKHRDDQAVLGQFLRDAQSGRIPKGSYLIIENLDRLSREEERAALRLWMDILDAGINIVQLHPETVFRHDKTDMVDIMRAIIELSRGHSESRMKSVRSLANWDRAIELARQEGQLMTGRLPSWIGLNEDGGPELILERAKVIRQIFAWATAGFGMGTIVRKLREADIPAFGSRVEEQDEDGQPYTRQADGERYGSGDWQKNYVQNILVDRRVLGEFQPRDRNNNQKGEPIPGYYPPVVTEKEFYAAQAAIGQRTNRAKRGRIGKEVGSLFSGLLKNARDGSPYYLTQNTDNGVVQRRLVNRSAVRGKAKNYTFDYQTFERAILSELRELKAEDILEGSEPIPDSAALEGELAWIKEKRAKLSALLLGDEMEEVHEQLKKLKGREEDLQNKLGLAKERKANPPADSWKTFRKLTDLLDKAEDVVDVRLRLRALLQRHIDTIWILIVGKAKSRAAFVQINFADGGPRRFYLIYRKAPNATVKSRQPGWWTVKSYTAMENPEALLAHCLRPMRKGIETPVWTNLPEMFQEYTEYLEDIVSNKLLEVMEEKVSLLDITFDDCERHLIP